MISHSEIEAFSDSYDLIHDRQKAISQNAARFTAEFILALKVKETLSLGLMHRFTRAYYSLIKEPGIYHRHPERINDPDGVDNFISLGTASYLLQMTMARDMLTRLRKNFYTYNNTNKPWYKNWACFFPWWNPGAIAHLKICTQSQKTRQFPGLFGRIAWSVAVFLSSWQRTQDGLCQSWQMVRIYQYQPKKFWYMDLAVQFFILRLFSKYPDGIGGVLAEYWQRTDHPTITLMKGTA